MKELLFSSLLVLSSVSLAQEPPKKQINLRAFMCESVDFAELNSLDFSELESMYCSAHIAARREADRAKASPDSDPRTVIDVSNAALAFMGKCRRIFMPAEDIMRRKFQGNKPDCAPYKEAFESALSKK